MATKRKKFRFWFLALFFIFYLLLWIFLWAHMNECKQYGGLRSESWQRYWNIKGFTMNASHHKRILFFRYTCRARSESWQLVKDGKVGWTWMHLLSTKGLRRWPTNNCQDVILLFLHLTFQQVKSISLWFSLWDEYCISHFFSL